MDIALLIHEQKLIDFINNVNAKGAIIASISSSPSLLAKAGVLKNKKYTVGLSPEGMNKLGFFDLNYFSEDLVVQDGNIITARGRGFVEFGITVGKAVHHQKLWMTFVKTFTMQIVDCSGDWATPRGSAFQIRPCSEAKRLIERPQESAQSERKSTTRFGDDPVKP